jgi:hypothetical protein
MYVVVAPICLPSEWPENTHATENKQALGQRLGARKQGSLREKLAKTYSLFF